MTRQEHLEWAKTRALEYADQGDVTSAVASITSDLAKHPETRGHGGLLLMTMLAAGGHFDRPGELRRFHRGVRMTPRQRFALAHPLNQETS